MQTLHNTRWQDRDWLWEWQIWDWKSELVHWKGWRSAWYEEGNCANIWVDGTASARSEKVRASSKIREVRYRSRVVKGSNTVKAHRKWRLGLGVGGVIQYHQNYEKGCTQCLHKTWAGAEIINTLWKVRANVCKSPATTPSQWWTLSKWGWLLYTKSNQCKILNIVHGT